MMKQELFPTIEENFFTLLRAGAFNITGTQLQPMSNYKWRKLQSLATSLGIAGIISSGANILKDDRNILPIIISLREEENFDYSKAELYSILASKRFKEIKEEERHAMDTSVETLELLQIIVANIDEIITKDFSLIGIIALGRYMRTHGHRVDFVKLNKWIERLGIIQLSSFMASLLIDLFEFDAQELEFMKTKYINSMKHYYAKIRNALSQDHHFKTISRLNLALIETTSYHLSNIKERITNIEDE